MTKTPKDSEPPLVLGGQGRAGQHVTESGFAVGTALLLGLLLLGVLCLR